MDTEKGKTNPATNDLLLHGLGGEQARLVLAANLITLGVGLIRSRG